MRIYQIILIFISLGWFQNAHAQAQLGNTIFGMEDDGCGTSITLSEDGSIVAIGYGDEGDGVVRVFEWDQSNWVQLGNDITAPNNKGYDFGRTLSLTGDGHTILIGDPVNNSGATYGGQLTVFTLLNNTWTLVGQPINGLAPDDRFGQSLAISKDGSRIIAGAPYNDIAGAASGMTRVFRLVNNIWTIQGTTINGQGANNWAGWAVDLSWSGDTIIIGEIHNADKGDNSGQVRIFTWSGTDWVKIAQDLNGQDVNDFLDLQYPSPRMVRYCLLGHLQEIPQLVCWTLVRCTIIDCKGQPGPHKVFLW
ncbi:MAG: hypothetical protein IPJ06_05045 [Saprospiraceae bacterium]|nr:hypothetical protein [Saprospiraceae bacterium]